MDDDEKQLRQVLLHHYGIRIGPHMSRYVILRLKQAGDALRELPVIGGEARTGLPVRTLVDPCALRGPDALLRPPAATASAAAAAPTPLEPARA